SVWGPRDGGAVARRWLAICAGVCVAVLAAAADVCAQHPATTTKASSGPVLGVAVGDALPGNPLGTDSLMSPVPAVPPRRAYQRPPGPGDPADPLGLTLPEGASIPLPATPGRTFRFAS